MFSSAIRGGEGAGVQLCDSHLLAAHATISDNNGAGLLLAEGRAFLEDSYVQRNAGPAILTSHRLEPPDVTETTPTRCTLRATSLGVNVRLTLNRPPDAPSVAPTKNWLALSHCDVHGNTQGFLASPGDDLSSGESTGGGAVSDLSSGVVNEVYVRKSVGDAPASAAFALYRWPARSPRSSRMSLGSQSQSQSQGGDIDGEQDADAYAETADGTGEQAYLTKRGRISSSSEDDWLVGESASSPRAED